MNINRIAVSFAMLLVAQSFAYGQNDVNRRGPGQVGPVMQAPYHVFLLFWQPAGVHFDPGGYPSDITYTNTIERFFSDLSGSSYLSIASQYTGACGPPNIPSTQSCYGAGSVEVTAAVVVSDYPHAGTHADPLHDYSSTDSDIQSVITAFINASTTLTPGLNTEFFVFTGSGIVTCQAGGCTDTNLCGWHMSYSLNNNPVVYAVVTDRTPGCGVPSVAPNQGSADEAIIVASHEFFESISDPLWVQSDAAWVDKAAGNEIGDNCQDAAHRTGPLDATGSNIHLNGNAYVVQQIWSNDDAGCVLAFGQQPITGPSIEYDIDTGANALAADSSATAVIESTNGGWAQSNALKLPGQPSWATNSVHVRVFETEFKPAAVFVYLNSDPSGSSWDVTDMNVERRDENGQTSCSIGFFGSPLFTLDASSSQTTPFQTPVCLR